MSFLVGGGAAAVLALLDLLLGRRYRLTVDSLHWWFLRLLVDGLQGAAAIVLIQVAALQVEDLNTPAVWVLAGIFSTRIIQSLQYSEKTLGIQVDLRDRFERLTLPLEEDLASASAAANAASDRRLAEELQRNGVSPELLARELIAAMKLRVALSTKAEDGGYLREIAAGDDPEEERLRVLVARAREIRLIGTVKNLKRTRRRGG